MLTVGTKVICIKEYENHWYDKNYIEHTNYLEKGKIYNITEVDIENNSKENITFFLYKVNDKCWFTTEHDLYYLNCFYNYFKLLKDVRRDKLKQLYIEKK